MNDMTYSMTGDMSHLCGELSATARVAFGYPGNCSRLRSAATDDGASVWAA